MSFKLPLDSKKKMLFSNLGVVPVAEAKGPIRSMRRLWVCLDRTYFAETENTVAK